MGNGGKDKKPPFVLSMPWDQMDVAHTNVNDFGPNIGPSPSHAKPHDISYCYIRVKPPS